MSSPQFPDPLGRRELHMPGATAHKAGLSLEDRVKALEQGAAGRPGPGVSNGCVLSSDTTQTGGVKWALPGLPAWTTVFQASGFQDGGAGAGTYILPTSGGWLSIAGTSLAPVWKFNAADYAVTGKTTQLRVLAMLSMNATAPYAAAQTVKVGIQPLTGVGGGAAALTYTLGTALAQSTFTAPAAASASDAATTISAPADAYYVLTTLTSAVQQANSRIVISAMVQLRHV